MATCLITCHMNVGTLMLAHNTNSSHAYMVQPYNGHHPYTQVCVGGWQYALTGVYYCGYLGADGRLQPLYIGRAIGDGGIRGRLLDHLRDDVWPGVTHFGFAVCATAQEAITHEAAEIRRFQPRFNTQGKSYG